MPALTDTRTARSDPEDGTLVIQPQGRLFDLKPKPIISCPPSSKSNT